MHKQPTNQKHFIGATNYLYFTQGSGSVASGQRARQLPWHSDFESYWSFILLNCLKRSNVNEKEAGDGLFPTLLYYRDQKMEFQELDASGRCIKLFSS